MTEFRSFRSLAKLLSAYPNRLYGRKSFGNQSANSRPKIKPKLAVFFRFLTTLFATQRYFLHGSALCLLSWPIINVISDLILHKKYINFLTSL